jgi:hypothetical protein
MNEYRLLESENERIAEFARATNREISEKKQD